MTIPDKCCAGFGRVSLQFKNLNAVVPNRFNAVETAVVHNSFNAVEGWVFGQMQLSYLTVNQNISINCKT